jgi:hypothetical protein
MKGFSAFPSQPPLHYCHAPTLRRQNSETLDKKSRHSKKNLYPSLTNTHKCVCVCLILLSLIYIEYSNACMCQAIVKLHKGMSSCLSFPRLSVRLFLSLYPQKKKNYGVNV